MAHSRPESKQHLSESELLSIDESQYSTSSSTSSDSSQSPTESTTETLSSSSSKTTVDVSANYPDAAGEIMPPGIARVQAKIIEEYLGGNFAYIEDAIENKNSLEEKNENTNHSELYANFRFFGKSLNDILGNEIADIAKLIASAEEKDIDQAVALVKARPYLTSIPTKLSNPPVEGTLIGIAAILGDVDLKAGIKNEKQRGAVERLIAAAKLSKEEVIEQLQCVTSEEAKRANQARKERYLAAVTKLGNAICETKANFERNYEILRQCIINNYFGEAKEQSVHAYTNSNEDMYSYSRISPQNLTILCDDHRNEFIKDLQLIRNENTKAGYIFDPMIFQDVGTWFSENFKQFGSDFESPESTVFWTTSLDELNNSLSSRDSQTSVFGTEFIIQGTIPVRVNRAPNEILPILLPANHEDSLWTDWNIICQAKEAALQKLCGEKTLSYGKTGS